MTRESAHISPQHRSKEEECACCRKLNDPQRLLIESYFRWVFFINRHDGNSDTSVILVSEGIVGSWRSCTSRRWSSTTTILETLGVEPLVAEVVRQQSLPQCIGLHGRHVRSVTFTKTKEAHLNFPANHSESCWSYDFILKKIHSYSCAPRCTIGCEFKSHLLLDPWAISWKLYHWIGSWLTSFSCLPDE